MWGRLANLDTHPDPAVTVAQVARYCGVSEGTVRKRITAGALRASNPGHRLTRVSLTDLRAFAERSRIVAGVR